jgi:hypothetical protein
VTWWYRQNLFLYSADREFESRPPAHVVHPAYPAERGAAVPNELGSLLRAIPAAANRSIRFRSARRRSE